MIKFLDYSQTCFGKIGIFVSWTGYIFKEHKFQGARTEVFKNAKTFILIISDALTTSFLQSLKIAQSNISRDLVFPELSRSTHGIDKGFSHNLTTVSAILPIKIRLQPRMERKYMLPPS